MPILTVALNKDQVAWIDRMVRLGRYRNSGEVMEAALHLLERQDDRLKEELDFLRLEYALGKASGKPIEIDPETFLADLKTELRSSIR